MVVLNLKPPTTTRVLASSELLKVGELPASDQHE